MMSRKACMKGTVLLLAAALFSSPVFSSEKQLQQAIEGKHRTPSFAQRDPYRNPLKTLKLFDLQPDHTVVEIWPGGGWYTEILAPYLKKKGQLIAAHYDATDTQAGYRPGSRERFEKKMKANKKAYGKVITRSLMVDEGSKQVVKTPASESSVDRVVAFRSAHGWYARGTAAPILQAFFTMLKPGGKLGIVQHQAADKQNWMAKNIGYVGKQYFIDTALAAGFKLEAEGYFNNNPLDTKHYEQGVWQLPPTLRGSQSDEAKRGYQAIGESDRMTLVFVKPG